MATTTFSGPVRSESTLKTISKNATTGAITEIITMGDGPVTLGDEDTTLTNATHSGRLIVVPAITANRTITLPSPVAGSHFKFIYGGAAEETENLIFDTGADANLMVLIVDTATAVANSFEDEVVPMLKVAELSYAVVT